MAQPVNMRAPDGTAVNTDPEHVESLLADGYQLAGDAPEILNPAPGPMPKGPAVPILAPEDTGPVNLRGPNGEAVNADPGDVESLLADGYQLADAHEVEAQRQLDQNSTLDAQAITAGEQFAQGATLGGYGAVAGLADDGYAKRMEARAEANPLTAGIAGVAGSVAPAVLSGGIGSAGALARMTPAGQLAALSTKMGAALAERAGTSALGRIGALAATGAAEGFVDSATRTVMGDIARGDVDISAERMLDAAWHGTKAGLLGGALGGAVGAGLGGLAEVGDALGRGARSVGNRVAQKFGGLSEQAGSAAYKAAVGRTSIAAQRAAARVGGDAEIGKTLLKRGLIQGGDTVDDIAARLPAAREAAGQELGNLLKEVADEPTSRAAILKRIEDEVLAPLDKAGTRDIADAVRTKLEKSGLLGELSEEPLETVATQAQRALDSHVDPKSGSGLMGATSPRAPEAAPAAVPKSGIMGEAAPAPAPIPAEKAIGATSRPVGGKRVKGVDSGLMGGRQAADDTISLQDLHALRRRFDQRPDLKWSSNGPAPVDITTDAMRDVRRTIEDAFEKASDEAAKVKGVTDFAARLKQAKREYSHLAVASDVSEQGAFARAANNRMGLNDVLAGVAGAASLGPAGALASVASKYVRDRSEGMIATTLYKLARGGVAKEKALEGAVQKTLQSLALPATRAAVPASNVLHMPPKIPTPQLQQMVAQARALQNPDSPESQQLDAMTLQLASESPEFAQAMRDKVLQKAGFIVQKLGPSTDPADPLHMQPAGMDRVSKSRADRFIQAANDPAAALDRLASGHGSAEDFAVVREITPSIHRAYVERVIAGIQSGKLKPTQQQAQRLHYALGAPISRETTPAYIAYFQKLAAPAQPPPEEPAPGQQPKPEGWDPKEYKADNHFASRTDQVMGGVDG